MAKADVLQLVADLGDGLADQTSSSKFYDDIVFELGLSKNESLVAASYVMATKNVATYAYPTTAIRLLNLFYDTTYLTPSDTKEVESIDSMWRSRRGQPSVWLVEQESRRQFTLMPVPLRTGTAVDALTPYSLTFPEANVTAFYTENRADVHAYEELVIALEVCVREFTRDSDHMDMDFAGACKQVADSLRPMLLLE